jgi:hypothetical protein
VYAFEITSILLVIAVVGAVVLARRSREPEILDPGQAERAEEVAERMAAAVAKVEGPAPDGDADVDADVDDDADETEPAEEIRS